VVDRHKHNAFHTHRVEINKKFTFQYSKVYGSTAEVPFELQRARTRVMGELTGFVINPDQGARQTIRMSKKSSYSYGGWSSPLRPAIRNVPAQDILRGQLVAGSLKVGTKAEDL
jgi:hypothetical protein